MTHQTFVYEGKNLKYRLVGSGHPVVLVHGFGEDGRIWAGQEAALAGYGLLIPELPGSGGSDLISDMSMEGMARALAALMESVWPSVGNGQPATVIGHSMGGYITLALAEARPELLAGIGLFHSTAFADSEERIETRRKGISFIREHGALAFLKTATPNMYGPATREKNPALIDEHIATLSYFTEAALIQYYESMMERPDRRAVLEQNKIPVLFVLGRHDTAVPLQQGLQQVHLPALAHVHLLETSGHMGMREEQDVSNALLLAFVSATKKRVQSR